MDKYLVSAIPDEQQVVIDVPEGFLRISVSMDDASGEGRLVLASARNRANVGEEVHDMAERTPILQMRIETPQRAEALARALLSLADTMHEWLGDEEVICEDDSECEDCANRGICFADDDDNG